jgi:phosphate transport system protein
LVSIVREMAEIGDRLASKIASVVANPDADTAAELERDDDAVDDLQQRLFGVMLTSDWSRGVEAAIDGALLGRFYERFADHSVNAGYQMYFFVTGEQLARPPD